VHIEVSRPGRRKDRKGSETMTVISLCWMLERGKGGRNKKKAEKVRGERRRMAYMCTNDVVAMQIDPKRTQRSEGKRRRWTGERDN